MYKGPAPKNGSGGMPNSVIGVSRRARGLYKEAQTIRFVSYACQSVTLVKGQQSGGTVPRRGNKHTNTITAHGPTARALSVQLALGASTFLLEMTTVDHYGQELHAIA